MSTQDTPELAPSSRGAFASRIGFILAAAGSAVGLGNIWKFPYITGENGGGVFVLIYLVCIGLVGIPIMMAEIMIGRAAQKQPVAAFHKLQGKKSGWASVGWLGVLAGFIILSYYIVVAGWAMDYTLKSVVNFTKPIHESADTKGIEYRVTAGLDEMRLMLSKRKATREAKQAKAEINNRVKPSVHKIHTKYLAGLKAAGAVNVVHVEKLKALWSDEPRELLEQLKMDEFVDRQMTDEQRKTFQTARDKLFEKPGFENAVIESEGLITLLEEVAKAKLLAAKQHYDGLSESDIRNEAEIVKRREIIFDQVGETFGKTASDGWTATFWAAVFMLAVILIVAGGIAGGIERTCKILMPALFVLILVMVVYGAFKPGFGEALSFVFKPDLTKLKPSGVLEALGHAFFTLSLGMGAMITYGSYQKSKGQLAGQSATIAVLDTGIALLACLMIFPIIFSYGQDASAGPGLVFMSMPLAFAEIGQGGMLLSIMFFGLLVFAALTSAISLLEVVASYFIDERGWSRRKAAWLLGGVVFLFGVPSAFSMDSNFAMSGWKPSFGMNFFDTMDYLASNWLLPLGGLLIAIYAGWVMPRKLRDAELQGASAALVSAWLVLIRFVAPAMVIIVLAQKVGILEADELLHNLFKSRS